MQLRNDPAEGAILRLRAWGPGTDRVFEQAPKLLGSEDDRSTFKPQHDIIADAHRRNPGFRIGRTDRVLDALVPAILGQKIQSKLANESLRKLSWYFGERAPGPHKLWLQPTPERLAELPFHDWHRINVERKRATIIRRAAERANRIEECASMTPTDAARRLQAFAGIGPWTTARTLMPAIGDADSVMVGDFHLKNTVSWALAGEPRGTDERMLELLEPYAGHRGRVTMLLKMAGVKAPAYGPRLSHMHFEDR
ncbi:MAG: DNA-3-methyladenine glycosylase 2 family protein [Acidimicrobiales bacterium]|nr:DNA-3-methyladenine glycosylase 2 family protein [Acidimicrobiales bacterium]